MKLTLGLLLLFWLQTASAATINITSPTSATTSPVNVSGYVTGVSATKAMAIYIDYNLLKKVSSVTSISASNVALAAGSHHLTIQAWLYNGAIIKQSLNFTVSTSAPAPSPSPSPTSNSGPVASFSTLSVVFPNQIVGTTSGAQFVMLTNTGSTTLDLSPAWSITGDFAYAGTGTCQSSLSPGASCTISFSFTPHATGTRTGTATIATNAANSPQAISLSGTGVSSTTSTSPTPVPSPSPTPTPSPSLALNYYVSVNGSDSNDGKSSVTAWKTIAHADSAITVGTYGTVVHVLPGTYSRAETYKSGNSNDARVTWVSETKWAAKFVSTTTTQDGAWRSHGSYVTVKDFDLTTPDAWGLEFNGNYDQAIGNRVHDIGTNLGCTAGAGIAFWDSALSLHDNDVIGNVIYNVGAYPTQCDQMHGIYFMSPRGRALNNIIFNIVGYGIHLWHNATQYTIANNTVFHAAAAGIIVGAGDSPCDTAGCLDDYTVVINNISVNNGTYGIMTCCDATVQWIGYNNVYKNNLTYGNGYGDCSVVHGSCSGTVHADPQFVNFTGTISGDYHLKSTSPAINAGLASVPSGPDPGLAPLYDFEGFPRPYGSGFDIGAYEWH